MVFPTALDIAHVEETAWTWVVTLALVIIVAYLLAIPLLDDGVFTDRAA